MKPARFELSTYRTKDVTSMPLKLGDLAAIYNIYILSHFLGAFSAESDAKWFEKVLTT